MEKLVWSSCSMYTEKNSSYSKICKMFHEARVNEELYNFLNL